MPKRVYDDFGDITRRLHSWSAGDRGAENELFEAVFPILQRLAHYVMKGERNSHLLEPVELVNQVYFRLAAARKQTWQNRRHFFAVAARAMRQRLIDYARMRRNVEFVTLEGSGGGVLSDSGNLELAVGARCLLDQIAEANPIWSLVLDLKYALGLTDREIAEAIGIKLRTTQRMLADARQWLSERADPKVGRRDSPAVYGIRRSRSTAQAQLPRQLPTLF